MGKEQPPKYYDEIYETIPEYNAPWNMVWPRNLLWAYGANMVPDGSNVIDLGCGPGQFASALHDMKEINSYVGYDFSSAAIDKARELFKEDDRFWFYKSDITDHSPITDSPHRVIVCMETLEHIEADLELIESLPLNTPIIISLPAFDDPGHVRHFPTDTSIINRYHELLDLWTVPFIFLAGGRWRIFHTMRKGSNAPTSINH